MLRKGIPGDGRDCGIRAETGQMDGGQSGDPRLGGRGSSERACYCGRLQREAGRGAGKNGHVTFLLRCEAVGVLDGKAEGDECSRQSDPWERASNGCCLWGWTVQPSHDPGPSAGGGDGLRRALARASCRVFEGNEHMTSQVAVNFLSIFSGVFKDS
jgi:hypothetical protein